MRQRQPAAGATPSRLEARFELGLRNRSGSDLPPAAGTESIARDELWTPHPLHANVAGRTCWDPQSGGHSQLTKRQFGATTITTQKISAPMTSPHEPRPFMGWRPRREVITKPATAIVPPATHFAVPPPFPYRRSRRIIRNGGTALFETPPLQRGYAPEATPRIPAPLSSSRCYPNGTVATQGQPVNRFALAKDEPRVYKQHLCRCCCCCCPRCCTQRLSQENPPENLWRLSSPDKRLPTFLPADIGESQSNGWSSSSKSHRREPDNLATGDFVGQSSDRRGRMNHEHNGALLWNHPRISCGLECDSRPQPAPFVLTRRSRMASSSSLISNSSW